VTEGLWSLAGWLFAVLGALYAVVAKRGADRSAGPTPESFQNLYSQVQRLERDVADWHDYVGRWTKRLDMRQRRAAGEPEDPEAAPADRKMVLRKILGQRGQ